MKISNRNVSILLQIIYAEDVAAGIKSFGFSLSGGYDMDANIYPGLYCWFCRLENVIEDSFAIPFTAEPDVS